MDGWKVEGLARVQGCPPAEQQDLQEPTERHLRLGPGGLTDPELLAVLFLGKAGPPRRVSGLASLLARVGGLKGLIQSDLPMLGMDERSLGSAQVAQLQAAVELGRRLQRRGDARPRLCTPSDIYRHLAPAFVGLPKEVFHVLALNSRNVLLGDVRVAEGSVSACPVDPREVFAVALATRATALVLAHNHPSGDPEPSREDLELTRQLAEGGRLLCVRVLDHLIIGDGQFVSLLERGLLPSANSPRRGVWTASKPC